MAEEAAYHPLKETIRLSGPVDTSEPYDPALVTGKTILITGGASGFGEGFFRKWAEQGANVIIGDINDARGQALVTEVRQMTRNGNHHYIHCDVTDWQSQVDFFHEAIKLSVTGSIDSVVANAGIADSKPKFENPIGLDADTPPKPDLKVFDVDMVGVLYTTHLAMFYLPRSPQDRALKPPGLSSLAPGTYAPDRHLLLIGSVASLAPLAGQVLYGVSKHGVLGLFRCLRATAFVSSIRVNMLCPYFIDTPIIPVMGRLVLAGGSMGKSEDVVEAGTRLMADTRIAGRALVVGPKVKVHANNDMQLVPQTDKVGNEVAIWEAYADDFEENEVFNSRFVRMLNAVEKARGWSGWAYDILNACAYPFKFWLRR